MRRLPALIAGAVLAAGVLIPQPALAATATKHPRAVTLLADSRWAVYQQSSVKSTASEYITSGGRLFATDGTGRRATVPGVDSGNGRLLLAGSIVSRTQTATGRPSVRWFDLRTRTGGTFTGRSGELLLGAGPDGWVMGLATGPAGRYGTPERLTYVHRDGTRTDLGTPYPDGQEVRLATSDTGIVATPAVSDETAFRTKVLYLPWKRLGTTWRTLYTTKDEQVSISCEPSSTTYVACLREPADGGGEGPYTHGLISLSGSGATWMIDSHPKACQAIQFATLGSNLVAVETTDSYGCTEGKLYRFTAHGGLVSGGRHHYSSGGIRVGLGGASGGSGRILVSSIEQRHIDTLTGVTRSPHILVRV